MMDNSGRQRDMMRFCMIGAGVCLLLGAWCWMGSRRLESRRGAHQALVAQIEQMNLDADVIQVLRAAPRLATERERPNDELLAEVRDSMAAAKIPLDYWIGNDPAPTVRVPNSPYKRLSVRLMFEELSLRQVVEFAFNLTQMDSALSIPYLRLHAPPRAKDETWNVDLNVDYLIYSPR